MSDFRSVLDDEVGKAVDESIKKNHGGKKGSLKLFSVRRFFSFSTFFKVTFTWIAILLAALIWFWVQGDSTISDLEGRLASKTVLIEKSDANTYRITDADPIIEDYTNSQEMPATDVAQSVDEPTEEIRKTSIPQGALAAAPIPDLFESTDDGLIPKARMSDGLTPFNAYRRSFVPSTNKPKLALVAVKVGMSRKMTEQMIKSLPPEVSFAFSPYAPDIKLLADAARAAGHEMWLMLPMENEDYPRNDPGPNTLRVNVSIEQNQARLLSTLGRTVGYVGLVSWPDHIFNSTDIETSPSTQQIFGRGLATIDSSTASDRDFGKKIAYANEFPFAKNNFWLDANMDESGMSRKMREALDYGSARDEVMVMFYPTPNSIAFLSDWLSSAQAQEFELAPASYVAEYKDE